MGSWALGNLSVHSIPLIFRAPCGKCKEGSTSHQLSDKDKKEKAGITAPRGLSSPWRRPLPTPRLVSGAPHSAGPQALMHSCTPRHRFSNRHRESYPSLGSQQSWASVPDPLEIRVSSQRRSRKGRPVPASHLPPPHGQQETRKEE